MSKVAIVIGATGLIGRALVSRLIDVENIGKIITLTRSSVSYSSAKVENHIVDFEHLELHSELFNADFLFSCLGTTLKQAGNIEAQRKVDLDYQFKAAQIAANNNVDHYLLVSSYGANDKSNRAYFKMKGELEQTIKSLPFKSISIFQPSILVGHRVEFRLGETIGSWLMKALVIIPIFKRFRPITGEQVAAKMVQVSQQPQIASEQFCLDDIFIN